MKKFWSTLSLVIAMMCSTSIGLAAVVDTFDGDLSAYTNTVLLDANGGGSNTATWGISGSTLLYTTSAFNGIEQTAFIRNGLSLGIGDEIQVEINRAVPNNGSQDLGLYVGGIAPTTGVRNTYVAIYARNNGQMFSRGFDGLTELGLVGATTPPALSKFFIQRTAVNDFDLGYYVGLTRIVLVSRLGMTNNDAEFVGFFTDVRGAGVVGFADNLTLVSAVPEPSSFALLGLGSLALLAVRRRA